MPTELTWIELLPLPPTDPIVVIECFAHAGRTGWESAMKMTSGRRAARKPEASGGFGHGSAFSSQVRNINFALPGGGAHGACTWGVLDRLLEEKDLGFEGLSATSAGAMNAAAFAYGLAVDGRDGARGGPPRFLEGGEGG